MCGKEKVKWKLRIKKVVCNNLSWYSKAAEVCSKRVRHTARRVKPIPPGEVTPSLVEVVDAPLWSTSHGYVDDSGNFRVSGRSWRHAFSASLSQSVCDWSVCSENLATSSIHRGPKSIPTTCGVIILRGVCWRVFEKVGGLKRLP